jgi:hypothetical protein
MNGVPASTGLIGGFTQIREVRFVDAPGVDRGTIGQSGRRLFHLAGGCRVTRARIRGPRQILDESLDSGSGPRCKIPA